MVEHENEKSFSVSLCRDIENHCPHVAVYRTADLCLLEKTLAEAVRRTEREVEEGRFSCCGPLWGTEYIKVG